MSPQKNPVFDSVAIIAVLVAVAIWVEVDLWNNDIKDYIDFDVYYGAHAKR